MNRQKQFFDNCFEVFLADTPESKKIHYQLRYQVYCDEMGVELNAHFPERLETDEWDSDAVHFLVRHKYNGQWLGCLRLVRHNAHGFPFQERCTTYDKLSKARYKSSVEISRLCVLKSARRFALKSSPMDVPEENRKISFLHDHANMNRNIIWGLYRAAALYSAEHDIKHWYILSSPALAYFVNKEGFDIQQIGDSRHRHNQRLPYYLSVNQVLENPLWREDYRNGYWLYSDLETEFYTATVRRQLKQIGVISFVSRV
ncbi:PEP-CTERM/exosortase system-associated acyltransferase [Methylomonas sp. 2BW1-5-20]|uniref:PEP-CTERM/exosortase system-associated acyltransferase n=1 Tax=Methylomonas sp. 2BW1-5-20 TaxID=3376686 RepID=UPI0040511E9A